MKKGKLYVTVEPSAAVAERAVVRPGIAARPYLDAERVASWGRSGGGSMTLNLPRDPPPPAVRPR
jgi:hypothetical protein